jgi:hypothetical protein
LDRRTKTPDGSGGASPTVVTARDDDDDLMVGDGQPDELTGAAETDAAPALPADEIGVVRDSSVFTFRRPVAAPVSPGPDDADGWTPDGSPADETVPSPVARASGDPGVSRAGVSDGGASGSGGVGVSDGGASGSGGAGVSGGVVSGSGGVGVSDGGASGSGGAGVSGGVVSASGGAGVSGGVVSASGGAGVSGGVVSASGGAGVSGGGALGSGAGLFDDVGLSDGKVSGSESKASVSGDGAAPPAADPSPPEPPAVSAAAFVWDPPEPATSPLSAARNFLRSSTAATDPAPPRTPAATVGPAKTADTPTSARAPSPARAAPAPAPARPTGTRPKGSSRRSARQAHLIVARVEPWSVMKFSFVVSLVAFVILFVAVGVLYGTLSALGVFTSLDHVVSSVTSSQNSAGVNASKWFTASRVLGYTALLGSINIVLITAMSTIGAVIYNLTSRLIGGVEVTLRETD